MRTTYIVSWNAEKKQAEVSVAGQVVNVGEGLTDLHDRTCVHADHLWNEYGILGEVKLKNKGTGQFSESGCSTYGEDPRETAG